MIRLQRLLLPKSGSCLTPSAGRSSRSYSYEAKKALVERLLKAKQVSSKLVQLLLVLHSNFDWSATTTRSQRLLSIELLAIKNFLENIVQLFVLQDARLLMTIFNKIQKAPLPTKRILKPNQSK